MQPLATGWTGTITQTQIQAVSPSCIPIRDLPMSEARLLHHPLAHVHALWLSSDDLLCAILEPYHTCPALTLSTFEIDKLSLLSSPCSCAPGAGELHGQEPCTISGIGAGTTVHLGTAQRQGVGGARPIQAVICVCTSTHMWRARMCVCVFVWVGVDVGGRAGVCVRGDGKGW